jgi:plastocyanin
MSRWRALVLALASLAAGCSACAAADARTLSVRIADMAFEPATVSAAVGDEIVWMNDDIVDHTATAEGGVWDLAVPVGTAKSLRLTAPGTFAYRCRFHPNMTGSVTVTSAP